MISLMFYYLRRSWLLGVASAVAVFAFAVTACRVFAQMTENAGANLATAFAQFMPKWAQSAFNVGPESMTQINGFLAVCLQHPFLLTVLLAVPISLLTAWFSGDVEKRTIALILCRPVSRVSVAASAILVTIFWIFVGVVASGAGFYGGAAWSQVANKLSPDQLVVAVMHLCALILAFAGLAAAVSALVNVRGDAVGWSLTLVLVMYVWNFLAQVWYAGGGEKNYSLFRFYKPNQILLQNAGATADAVTLLAIGAAGFAVAVMVFRFRDFSV